MNAGLRVSWREINCASVDTQPIGPLLGALWRDPVCAPGALVPGRHGQLARAPPVRRGHSQPQTDNLIFITKIWNLNSFFKGFHVSLRDTVFQLGTYLNIER